MNKNSFLFQREHAFALQAAFFRAKLYLQNAPVIQFLLNGFASNKISSGRFLKKHHDKTELTSL